MAAVSVGIKLIENNSNLLQPDPRAVFDLGAAFHAIIFSNLSLGFIFVYPLDYCSSWTLEKSEKLRVCHKYLKFCFRKYFILCNCKNTEIRTKRFSNRNQIFLILSIIYGKNQF